MVAGNIMQSAFGVTEDAQFQHIPLEIHKLQLIPLGKTSGIMGFNKNVMVSGSAYDKKKEIEH